MHVIEILKSKLPSDIVDHVIMPYLLPKKDDVLIKKREVSKQIRNMSWEYNYRDDYNGCIPDYNIVRPLRDFLRISKWDIKYMQDEYKTAPLYLIITIGYGSAYHIDLKKTLHSLHDMYFNPSNGDYYFTKQRSFEYEYDEKTEKSNEKVIKIREYVSEPSDQLKHDILYKTFCYVKEKNYNILPSHYKNRLRFSRQYPFVKTI